MIDIVSIGNDIGLFNTDTVRAANILSVQFNSLEYAPLLGIDLAFFLSDQFSFQSASFKSYLIQVLASNGVNVASLDETVDTLMSTYTFNITPDQNSTGLIAR